jgi:LytS/YehU family sensor histidine kinase
LSYSFDRKNWSEIHGNTIRLKELASGNYQLFVRQKNLFSGNIIVYPLLKFSIAEPFWKTSWFLFLIALIFITSVYFVYSFNIKRITAREKQKAELLKRIAETKLEALQSQMNPHFIFNSLTSIHNYIIKSDVDNALLHMDKFAKLTRQTLEFSSRMQITLIEELEYLSNFIALENMRFGNRVGVSINAGELDTTKILIPPLLIQPLIENSFEHGFTDRDKKYNLALSFSVAKNQLIVRLSDDGIGFHASTVHPESKALSIIREGLLLIDSTLEGDFSINCENNQTLIRFVLPLVTI